ncbi:hypothetical protein QUB08_30725 [Microcoleus sp. BR0-C5]|uniref:hypothetical protein n=1 Tax=Microcoleus sp. BR0-C5 TaxID=2818713 RepID=UPI002FD24986
MGTITQTIKLENDARSHLNALVAMAVVLVKYDRQFYRHIGFSQGEIVGKGDRNLHNLYYLLISIVSEVRSFNFAIRV